jgi:hypothetical protein
MFNFLKGSKTKGGAKSKSAPPKRPEPHFEIVSMDQWSIAFRSRTVYPICQSMALFISGGPNQSLSNCRIEVFINSSRLISKDMIEYTGELQHAPPEFAELFRGQEPSEPGAPEAPVVVPPPSVPAGPPAIPTTVAPLVAAQNVEVTEHRVAQRANRAFRVVSRDLVRFKAMCGDISSTGIRLIADEAIEMGKTLELDLDFDDFRFPKVRFKAEVVWCKQRDDKTWWIGLRFLDMQDQEKRLLETYVAFVSRMQAPMEADSAAG